MTFECQPFAESLEYQGVNTPHITTQTKEISLTVNGTVETGCIITIKIQAQPSLVEYHYVERWRYKCRRQVTI